MRFQPFLKPVIWSLVVFGLGYWIFSPFYFKVQGNFHRAGCMSQLKQITLACAQYLEDNDRRFPAISCGDQGWADSLQPYLETYAIFHCPSVGERETQSSDYFLSARVANLKTSQLKFPAQTLSFGEGLANGGTNSHFSELPFDWKSDGNSPAQRHLTGANYAFVDGHVKWIRPERISTLPPTKNEDNWKPTFAVR